jgi:SAM-dependent methyltransferase
MNTLRFGEQSARRLEAVYMTPDIVRQREATLAVLKLSPGLAVIDIGSGPGFLCESMAATVGPGGRVLGVDISDDLLAAAQRRNSASHITYRRGDAEALDVPDASFDVAVSTQVFEYVPDCDRALHEMHRILRRGGRALVVATDWDGVVWHSSDRERMARLLRAWEAHCADPRLPRTLAPRLKAAGFKIDEVSGHPIINLRLGSDTYSEGIMELMANFVRKRHSAMSAEVDAWTADQRALDEQGGYFFALTRYLFLATKAS